MERPLVHIGYHKTGTNWLQREWWGEPASGYRWLGKKGRDHPVRRIVKERPFEFDAVAVREAFEPLRRDAEEAGLFPVVSLERLSGHPFSGGHDSRQIADRLAAVFPDARVVMVVREQRSMLVSTYKQYVHAGGSLSLREFVRPPTSNSGRVPMFDLRHFEYDHLIRYYRSLFGGDSVLPLAYEQFVSDPRAFVQRIADFAGRPLTGEQLDGLRYDARPNRSPSALTLEAARLLNRVGRRTELNPAPLLRIDAAARVSMRLQRRDTLGRTPRLVARAERRLQDLAGELTGSRFVESNRRTAELLGVDLSRYGWPV